MIKVDRGKVKAPTVLTDPKGKGAQETREAKRFFSTAGGAGAAKFEFKVYKDATVKEALTQLFHGKCAYCEANYAVVQTMDVEHWRPKSSYYWLAAAWENLLPSCTICNRTGKRTLFPLKDPQRRWADPRKPNGEDPLLLSPCGKDDPKRSLEFSDKGMVVPRKGDLKGKTSIEVFRLYRPELTLSRQERRLQIIALIDDLEMLAELPKKSAKVVAKIEEKMKMLKKATQPEAPYAQMARQIIEPFRKRWLSSAGKKTRR